MTRSRIRMVAATSVLGAACALLPLAAAAAGTPRTVKPHIVATPSSVMVNSKTALVGKNFPAKHTLTIEECSLKSWIAPQDPCDTTDALSVKTNAAGGFKHSFTVHVCGTASVPPGFSETCYIGEPTFGVDNGALVGAATITVTGP